MSSEQESSRRAASLPETRQITVKAVPGRVLSKSQKAFNRLLTRIENLRREIRDTTEGLERALREYETHVRPHLVTLAGLQKELARALAPFLRSTALKRRADRDVLAAVVANLIHEVAGLEGAIVDEDLRSILDSLEKRRSPSEIAREKADFEAMRANVEAMFGAAGVDLDLSDLGPDATPEELHARVAEAMHAARERGAGPGASGMPGPSPQRRTRKQSEREKRALEAEEARRRTIGAIYKQLAKVLHPDLEPDAAKRIQKLELMQQLTAAYRANDLHTLLRLELAWLHREEGDIERLTDEKLAIYNAVLREQVAELEHERDNVGLQPRFQVLVVEDPLSGPRIDSHPSAQVPRLKAVIASMREDLERLNAPDATDAVRAIIGEVRAQRQRGPRGPF